LIIYKIKMANVSQDIGVFFSLEGNIKPIIAVAVIIITKKTEIKLASDASFKIYPWV